MADHYGDDHGIGDAIMGSRYDSTFDAIEQDIHDAGLNEGDYCIIVYASVMNERFVKFVYASINDFSKRIQEDGDSVDPKFNLQIELWVFD